MRPAVLAIGALIVIAGTFTWYAHDGSAASPPGSSDLAVAGINNRGQVVGTSTGEFSTGRVFVWRKGSLRLLSYGWAEAINDRGEILATRPDAQSVLWVKGRAKRLHLACAWALNDRGQVLGVPHPSGGDCIRGYHALWTDGRSQLLPFDGDVGVAMNDEGQVVGLLRDDDAGEWQGGTVTDLGPGFPVAINDRGEILGTGSNGDVTVWQNGTATDIGPGSPVAINERGEVIGYTGPAASRHAFLWRSGTRTDLGTLGGATSVPTAISTRGQVVGNSTDSRHVQHGFVWQNGTMIRLPSPKGYARRGTRAVAINDHNQIVGDNCLADCEQGGPDSRFAVLWTLHGRRIKTLQIAKGHSGTLAQASVISVVCCQGLSNDSRGGRV